MLEKDDQGRLVYRYDAEHLYIEPWGPNALRLRATKHHTMPSHAWALLDPQKIEPSITIQNSSATLTNGNILTVCSHEIANLGSR